MPKTFASLLSSLILLISVSSAVDYQVVDRNGVLLKQSQSGIETYPLRSVAVHLLHDLQIENIQSFRSESGDISLTLDARLQMICETVMRKHGIGRGSCVLMEATSGELLAMVSVPSFDPDLKFVKRASEYETDALKPYQNHALSSYSPAATYLPVTLISALSHPDLEFTQSSRIDCPGAIYHAGRWWKDWYEPGRGPITFHEALQWSCGVFFFQLSLETGIERIASTARKLGFGRQLLKTPDSQSIVTNESPGIIACPDWMEQQEDRRFSYWAGQKKSNPDFRYPRRWREQWSDGHTMNTAIGQGFMQATPLQINMMMNAIASGGIIHPPRLLYNHFAEKSAKPAERLNIEDRDIAALQAALRSVVTSGTAQRANLPEYEVAGKTGTSQAWLEKGGKRVKDNRALFTGFAPYSDPKYTITIVIEGGTSGGRDTGPVVKEIFQRIAQLEAGKKITIEPLEPAKGHLKGIQLPHTDSAADLDNEVLDPVQLTQHFIH